MPKKDDDDDPDEEASYNEARKMAEKGLEAYARGDRDGGDLLIDEATDINPLAVQDIYDELEEDEGSDHDPFG